MMKIIQIMPEFGLAGAEIMCENLTYELLKAGNTVIVVSMYDYRSAITERMENAGIDIRYLGKKSGMDFSMIEKMRKIFKEEKPDAIHTHLYVMKYAIPAAKGVKCKRIHTVHSVAGKENGRMERKINKLFYKFAHVVPVALSEKVRDTVVDVYKIKADNIPVIYNGIPLDKCLQKTDYSIEQSEIRVLHIGRFVYAKNHIEMINAICQLHNKYKGIKLKLIGTGELKEQIMTHIVSCGAESFIEMHGLTDNVYPHIQQADIFILPSVYEGIPMTLIEAMGSSMPVIASNVGGIPDMIIDGKDGLLCEPTAESIEAKLDEFITDEALRKLCGKNAFITAQYFSAKIMGDEYESLYKRCYTETYI